MISLNLNEFINLKKNPKNSIKLIIIVMVLAIIAVITELSDLTRIIYVSLSTILILLVIFFLFDRIRSTKKGKIGVIIAIITENNDEKLRMKNDFYNQFKKLMQEDLNLYDIHFMDEYHASKFIMNPEKYLEILHFHFILYGLCKTRKEKGINYLILEMKCAARHNPIPNKVRKNFSKSMEIASPSEHLISTENEFSELKLTSKVYGFAAKFILGLAAAYSNAMSISLRIHKSLYDDLEVFSISETDTKQTSIQAIKTDLPKILSATSALLAAKIYYYRVNLSTDKLNEFKQHIDFAHQMNPKNIDVYIQKAVYHFLKDRDIEKSLVEIAKITPNEDTCGYYYSLAFLKAYKGDVSGVSRLYDKAFIGDRNPKNMMCLHIEDFILKILALEPERYQLWFCVGYINYTKKEDLALAKEFFDNFLREFKSREENRGPFKKLNRESTGYIQKIGIN